MRRPINAFMAVATVMTMGLHFAAPTSARDGQLSLLNDKEAELLDGRHSAHHDKPSEQSHIPELTNSLPLSVATLKTDDSVATDPDAGPSDQAPGAYRLQPPTEPRRAFKSSTAGTKSPSWIERFLQKR